ncbi:hypothetical protein DU971_17420 [Vibrio parahaemolyticus]|nr:hypothetical protein [Vibrio parahaemolyticus]KOC97646.1 hypothetical protein ACS82_19535 [Vibrio parahaemolyticus]
MLLVPLKTKHSALLIQFSRIIRTNVYQGGLDELDIEKRMITMHVHPIIARNKPKMTARLIHYERMLREKSMREPVIKHRGISLRLSMHTEIV